MDWGSVVCAGIGGGIGGLLAGPFLKKIPQDKKSLRAGIIGGIAIIMAQVAPHTPLKPLVDRVFFQKNYFDEAAEKFGQQMQNDPVIRDKLKTLPPDQISAASKKYGAMGIYWLDEKDLNEWAGMKLKLAESSTRFCAGMITGNANREDLVQAFNKLPKQELDNWFVISHKSMVAAIQNENNYNDEKIAADFKEGLSQILSLMSKEDGEKMVDILQDAESKSEEEVCWAMKALFQTSLKLPAGEKEVFLRTLAVSL